MIQRLLSLCAPGSDRARLSTLIFHRVTPRVDPLFPTEVDEKQFDRICGWIKSWFNVLPLGEAVDRLYRGDLPERALSITFDDGYADNCTVAAPVLQRYGLPCTFFVATGFLDGGCMWNDCIVEAIRRTEKQCLDLRGLGSTQQSAALSDASGRRTTIGSLIDQAKYLPTDQRQRFVDGLLDRSEVRRPADLMMTSQQVLSLRRMRFDIGAHTVSHPILARLGVEEMRQEIESSKSILESMIHEPVKLFAYPNGKTGVDYNADAVKLARAAGFDAAVSTNWGVSTSRSDRFQLARFTPWDRSKLRFAARLVRNSLTVNTGRG